MEVYKIGKTKVNLPTGWHDISFEKGIDILSNEYNEVKTLSILSGESEDKIRDSTDIDTIYYFANAFTFLNKLPDTMGEFPLSIKLGDERILMPYIVDKFDLAETSFGQVGDMELMIKKMCKTSPEGEKVTKEELIQMGIEQMNTAPYLVAIYLYKIVHYKYDGKEAMKFVERIKKEMSFKDVVSMGYFFLQRLPAFRSGSNQSLLTLLSMKRRLLRVLKLSIRHLVYRLRLIWYRFT